jgi:hypothetical protein
MSETKHTPGPWRAEAVMSDDKHDICIVNPVKPTGETGWPIVLASVYFDHTEPNISKAEADANAQLIAAAPELLEALIKVVAIADRRTDEFDSALAAIAKAKGIKSDE